MRVTPKRLALLHLALAVAGLAVLLALACGPSEEEVRTAELVERYRPTLEDAGLGWGLGRIGALVIRVHPDSDGGTFAGEPYGMSRPIYGYAGEACASYPGERVIWVASFASPVVCHELAHVARSDVYSETAGECIGPGDHDYFATVDLNRKCAEVAR